MLNKYRNENQELSTQLGAIKELKTDLDSELSIIRNQNKELETELSRVRSQLVESQVLNAEMEQKINNMSSSTTAYNFRKINVMMYSAIMFLLYFMIF